MSSYQISESSEEINFQCVMVGDACVGKSSFLIRFAEDIFIKNTSTTVGIDFRFKSMIVDDYLVKLQIFDTAGQEHFRSVSQTYFKKADGIILMFDLSSEESFNNLGYWIQEIKNNCRSQDIPVILIGHKNDLVLKRQIEQQEAHQFAKKHQMEYIEASAKENQNVSIAYAKLVQQMIVKKWDLVLSQKSINSNLLVNISENPYHEEEEQSIIKIQANRRGMLISNQNTTIQEQPKNVQCSCCNNQAIFQPQLIISY